MLGWIPIVTNTDDASNQWRRYDLQNGRNLEECFNECSKGAFNFAQPTLPFVAKICDNLLPCTASNAFASQSPLKHKTSHDCSRIQIYEQQKLFFAFQVIECNAVILDSKESYFSFVRT